MQLANSYMVVRRYVPAATLLERALKTQQSELGDKHADTLETMFRLAWCYECLGHLLDKGIPLLEQALQIRRDKLGEDHPDTLFAMNRVGWAYENTRADRQSD